MVGSLGLIGACGGGDADTASENAAHTEEGDGDTGSGTQAGGVPDPAEVANCLDEAGYQTVPSSEVLSEQQMADQMTMFGQTESLTFDAETNPFAGGVSFYESPEKATERAEKLADAAKAQSLVGNALVNIAAGTDYDDAVTAAEECLGA